MGVVVNVSQGAMDMALYGSKAGILSNYLQTQMQNMQPSFNSFSQRMFDAINASYQYVTNTAIQYGLMNQLTNQGLNVVDNYFIPLTDFHSLQTANITMQRWVMSHPEVSVFYANQNIDGYSDSYKNIFGDEVGHDTYNNRILMNGIVQPTDDGFVISHYMEDYIPGDRGLELREQCAILDTREAIDHILRTCDFDFTVDTKNPPKINKEM